MSRRKGIRIRRMAAVLLSAVLITGMLWDAVPVTVLAQETTGQQENIGGSGTEPVAGDTKPEEKTETAPVEGTGSEKQEETEPEGQEEPGTTEGGGETEDGDGLTGQESGGGMEEKPQEPGGTEEWQPKPGDGAGEEQPKPEDGTGVEQPKPGDGTEEEQPKPEDSTGEEPQESVSENDVEQETVQKQRALRAAPAPQAGIIAGSESEGWVLDTDGKLTISSDAGMTNWNHIYYEGTFYHQVTSVEIQSGVTSIGNESFGLCINLTEVTISEDVTSIGEEAFRTCSKLTEITIPKNVTSIGGNAFLGCSSLTEIMIPKSVASIGEGAFSYCSKLTGVTMQGETPPTVGDKVFTDCGFVKNNTQGIHVPEGKAQTYKDAWPDWASYIADDAPTPPAETHEHNGVTFTAWTETDSLPDMAGNYYLTENVTLNNMWSVSSETTLCLNGKTISVNNGIQINGAATLNLYDCRHAGKITGGTAGGIFNIGTSHMYGGEISGNRNSASNEGGGVTLISSQLIVGGDAVISGNTNMGKENNVFLTAGRTITIDSSNPLSGSAKIGITTATKPTAGNPVNITGENGADYSQYFQSDDPDYEIVNGENNVVQLVVKHTHEADMAWQQDADGHWHSCKNGCEEKLDYAVHTFEGNKCNVCGYIKTSTEEHKHNGVTFTAWTATDSLPDTAGNYYLTENVTLSATWNVPSGTTALCLNGKTISAEGNANNSKWLIFIEYTEDIKNDRTWNLFDCAGGGQITGGQYGCVGNGTTFYMYGGKITGSIGNGVTNTGAFYMYGGEISGNGDGGTCCEYGWTITVGGSALIAGNNPDNVWVGVDSLIEIDEENPLSGSAKIGITTATKPTAGNPVNITGENGADYSRYFQSDNPDYVIVNGENNVVQLAVKPHTHNLTRVDAKTATCTEDGNTAYYTCDGCDKWFSDESGTQVITDKTSVVIPAAGHAFDTEWGYKAADGHAHSCKNCDAHDEVQAHTPGDAATESTPQTCTECGYIIKPAIGHTCDPRLVEKKEPDCTTAGKEAYYHCEGCGKNYEDEAGTRLIADISAWGSIAAFGHDWGEWTVTKPATATTPGEKERICKRCNEKETEIIPKKGGGNKPGGGSGSGGNSGGGSDDNSGGNSGDNGGDNSGNQDSSGNGSGSSGGNGNVGGSVGNTGGAGAGTSGKPGASGTRQPRVKQEKEGNIRKEVRVEGESTLDAAVETPLSELADMVLTKEEKQKAAGGTDVRIVLDVKDASAVVSAADKTLVEKALNGPQAKGYTLGQYLDISLYKVVGNSRNLITETNGKIRVTIDVPDSLKNTDAAKTRTFAVIRVHNGKAELLADLDDNADTITIETDRFSTYAVVYKDTAGGNGDGAQSESGKPGVIRVSTKSDSQNSDGGKDGEPKTEDRTPLELSATLAMIAGLTYLLLYFADRRHGMTEETKKELVSGLIAWAKRGGRCRTYLALAAIFVLLVYYHSIGKKSCAEWREVYGE